MTRQAISTTGAPAAIGPYSQAHRRRRPRVLQRPARPRPGDRRPRRGGVEAQAERALENLARGARRGRASTGRTWSKTTIFLADIGDFAAVNARVRHVHAGPAARPLDRRGGGAAQGRPRRDRGDRAPAGR